MRERLQWARSLGYHAGVITGLIIAALCVMADEPKGIAILAALVGLSMIATLIRKPD